MAAQRLLRLLTDGRSRASAWLQAAFLGLVRRLTRRRAQPRRVQRSLWAGAPILTLPIKARAERLLGVQADTLVYETYFITDDFTYNLAPLLKAARWFGPLRGVARTLIKHGVLAWACLRYDRFHFFCDQGLLPTNKFAVNEPELQTLRALGKEVFFYAYGADVRARGTTEALGAFHCCLECPAPGTCCICDDARAARNQTTLATYATGVFSMGDMIHYTPRSRNDLYYWPIDLAADGGKRYAPAYPQVNSELPLRIAHAPNHRGFKGTRFLIDAVAQLQREGCHIELTLVERVPNREALAIYRTADLVFDQCLIGFHGYFALEALAMGKPVIVYIRDPKLYLLAPDECPFINATPTQLLATLRELAADRPRLRQLGIRGRQYIEKYFSVPAFAARLERALSEAHANRAA